MEKQQIADVVPESAMEAVERTLANEQRKSIMRNISKGKRERAQGLKYTERSTRKKRKNAIHPEKHISYKLLPKSFLKKLHASFLGATQMVSRDLL
ncbi:hypothetical protein NC651_017501 [Populus alba x Populus x berolinensis]|nr:hypothetical protein NC651_017501 [Populus alba x Populus x berolinensis]